LPYKNSQESLESSAICVCCLLCKWSVAVVIVYLAEWILSVRQIAYPSPYEVGLMMGSQWNTHCYDWPFT